MMRTAVIAAVALVLVVGGAFAIVYYAAPSPMSAAEDYLKRIVNREFAGIEQHFSADEPHPAGSELEEGFNRFAEAYELEEIERVELKPISQSWRVAEYSYRAALHPLFEPLEVESNLKLRRSGLFAWKVDWANDLPSQNTDWRPITAGSGSSRLEAASLTGTAVRFAGYGTVEDWGAAQP